MPRTELLPAVAGLSLFDHHCHGVVPADLTREEFEGLLTEGDRPHPGGSLLDSQLGLALRRWCAPLLDLPRHAEAEEYLSRRAELGHAEVTGRMLRASRLGALAVDTGFTPLPLLSPAELGVAAGAPAYEIVRLEPVAEGIAAAGGTAAGFPDAVRAALAERSRHAVGAKSIAAYRVGLELAGRRPTDPEVVAAAGRWLRGLRPGAPVRLADEVLHRFLIYTALDLGLPVQIHSGLGDRDVHLHRCDPLLLTDLLRDTEAAGVPVLLLHNYPYHRHAGYLAQVFSHVYLDVSLALHNVGRRAGALLEEALELAPFGKLLYASDAFALPELYYLGAVLFRRALSDLLSEGLVDDAWSEHDAGRIATMIGGDNARRVYRLPHPDS
ncbi:amidohydrolase family protein [Rugosimonospora acidiphila]|uniref:Amidohydrolase family protein n=1 Tax=Rugosimonospora acidiphila TaxID=556531 RepID=A0ABP9S4K1_9ACTN